MKGIIVDYFQEKGFGFIKDESEIKRFFHISEINEKHKFINNITDYFYTDWEERKCFVVDFTPTENSKGLNAINISLTDQVFNEISIGLEVEALITDIRFNTDSLTRIVPGIKKGEPAPIGATQGSNGTYRIGFPETIRKLNLYFRRIDNIGWDSIDIRKLVLDVNNRNKLTTKLVDNLKENLVEKIVSIYYNDSKWSLIDDSILII